MTVALTPDEQQIARARQLAVNRAPEEVLSLLHSLAEHDKFSEKKTKLWAGLASVAAVAGFIMLVFTFSAFSAAVVVIDAVVLAVFIYTVVQYQKWKSTDLADNFRVVAVPFITLLREDMNPNDPMHVKIDLRPCTASEKKVDEQKLPKTGGYYNIVHRVFRDPWFSGDATFADGTKVSWQVIDRVTQVQRTKRNPRGKIKTKTKEKRRTNVSVTLTFPTNYELEAATDAAKQKKHSITLRRADKTTTPTSAAFPMLVDLIAEGYKRVSAEKSA